MQLLNSIRIPSDTLRVSVGLADSQFGSATKAIQESDMPKVHDIPPNGEASGESGSLHQGQSSSVGMIVGIVVGFILLCVIIGALLALRNARSGGRTSMMYEVEAGGHEMAVTDGVQPLDQWSDQPEALGDLFASAPDESANLFKNAWDE
jgi:hypothetical protein